MRNLNFLNSNNQNHKSLRVRTNIGDTYLSVNLDQTYESLDILSLKIYQRDVYRLFDADYSIIVGRVTAQDIGIPNCRISVFVPNNEDTIIGPTQLDDIKKIEAATIYPYKTVFDKDGYGKIYNLLPRYSRNRGFNGFPTNEYAAGASPKTPVGTFPEKEEILTNETLAYVYDKYYKYSTFTNESGDYILVVPSNRTYSVNMSCDITDIGRFSTTYELLKAEGAFPDSYFTEDGNINTEIPLERLPNIDIQNQSIYVKPLWSQNPDNGNVGVNRLDFKLQKKIQPFATVFGNFMSHNKDHWWRYPNQNNGCNGDTKEDAQNCPGSVNPEEIKIGNLQAGTLKLRVFNIKNTVPEYDADLLNSGIILNNYDYNTDIELLPESKYRFEQDNGNAYITIPCNRNKVITNEFGEIISVADDNEAGAFTSFRGYFILENENGNVNPEPGAIRTGKIRLKVPQFFDYTYGRTYYDWGTDDKDVFESDGTSAKWIWKHFKFDYGEIYSWSQYNDVNHKEDSPQDEFDGTQTNILYFGEKSFGDIPRENYLTKYPNSNTLNNYGGEGQAYINFYNHLKEGTSAANGGNARLIFAIKKQWLNCSLFFPNFAYNTEIGSSVGTDTQWLGVDTYIVRYNFLEGNIHGLKEAPLGGNVSMGEPGGDTGLQNAFLSNGATIKTDFFKFNKEDLLKFRDYRINNNTQLGFRLPQSELKGQYPRYNNGTPTWLNQDNGDDVGERYFLIGRPANNSIDFLFKYL